MYKKKSNMLMANQVSSEKFLDRSLEECFNELSEDIDMTMFLKNMRHLKDSVGNNVELINSAKRNSTTNTKSNNNARTNAMLKKMKQKSNNKERKESHRDLKANKREGVPKSQMQLPVQKVIIKNKSAEKLTNKMTKIEDVLKTKLNEEKERSKTKERMDEGKLTNFYNRLENHQLKTQAKINIIKTKKKQEEKEMMTFKPHINLNNVNVSKSFIDESAVNLTAKEEKIRRLQLEKQMQEEKLLQKECTFKPNIKRKAKDAPRSLNDLYTWKEQLEMKKNQNKQDREEELKKEYTFTPSINKGLNNKRDSTYENPGDRLYAIHKIKMNDKLATNEKDPKTIDYPLNIKRMNVVSQSLKQNSDVYSRRSINTSANNSYANESYKAKIRPENVKEIPSNNRNTSPRPSQKHMNRVNQKPMARLFDVEENKSISNISRNTNDQFKINKQSLNRSASKNFMEENLKRLKEEERLKKELKLAKEKEKNQTQKKKYYNAKKDKKLKLNDLEDIVNDVNEIGSYFNV